MSSVLSRRKFIRRSAFAVGSLATVKTWAGSPNSDIRVVVVGLRNRGKSLVDLAMKAAGAKLVGVCDVDAVILEERAAEFETKYDIKLERFSDYRSALDRADIDAVALATPNHWHALQTIWGCQAGKDVYVEKPVCHSIWEGRRMVKAAEKYSRIVQPGFQNRSDIGLKAAFSWIKEGNIGAIKMARGLCYRNRSSIGKQSTRLSPPESLDYNTWLGPAQDKPMYRTQLHYDWHWDYNTGNGDIGNQGPHEMDLIRWIISDPDHAESVVSFGGRFAWDDGGNTPNMHIAQFDWGTIPVLFEVRDLWINPETNSAANFKGNRVGVIVSCEGGEFRGGRGGGIVYDDAGKRMERFKGDGGHDHFPAFLRAVRSRKQSDLAITLENGYKSSVLSHLANISYQVGREVSEDEIASYAGGDEHLNESYGRYSEHLDTWKVDLAKDRWTLGEKLRFDPKRERFVGGNKYGKANKLVKPRQRRQFAVRAKV